MPPVYDNWERLVEAVLDRLKLRQIALCPSFDSVLSDSSFRFSFDSSLQPDPGVLTSDANIPDVQAIAFEEIKLATRNFRFLIGEGRLGHVFKGWIDRKCFTSSRPGFGMTVAVKKWSLDGRQCCKEPMLHHLTLLDHPNLVKFVGYCSEENDLLLIYDYMPNGTLGSHLFGGRLSLSWDSIICLAVDVARGLTFLHGTGIGVAHGNINASNILLDSEFKAKLSGFSLARYIEAADMSSTQFGADNFGEYRSPTTEGGDVFDFGVLLLELICGRPVVDKTKVGVEQDLVRWVKLHSLNTFLDNMLGGDYPYRAAGIAANLALRCLSLNPDERPLMAQVLFELEHLKLNADEYMI